jgi:hypothetical protein
MKKALFFLAFISLLGFKKHTQKMELNGWWDAELSITASKSVQFKMWFNNKKAYLVNGIEKMEMLPIRLTSNPDSLIVIW